MKPSRFDAVPVSVAPEEMTNKKPEEPKSGMYVRRVVSEFVPMDHNGTKSFGQILDEMINETLKDPQGQIMGAEIVITENDWWKLRHG